MAGLAALGVPAEVSGQPEGDLIKPTRAIPCFSGPAAGEVVAGGRKLVGSAMRRFGNAILQHGSILEGWDGVLQAGCLGLKDDSSLRPAVATLGDLLGAPPAPEELVAAIVAGFSRTFGVSFGRSALTAGERGRAALLERERYGHERFTVRRDSSLAGAAGAEGAPVRADS